MRKKTEIGLLVLIVAGILATIVIFGTSEKMEYDKNLDTLYLDIDNLNTTKSSCEAGYSEKDIFFDRLWKTSLQNRQTTDEIWTSFDKLNKVYENSRVEYLAHLNICDCTNQVTAFIEGEYTGELRSEIPKCVFKFLPDVPYNLNNVAEPFMNTWDPSIACVLVGEDYWKQPEFYKRSGVWFNYYKEKPFGLSKGYAGYSSEAIALITPGDKFSTCTFANAQSGMSSFAMIPLGSIVLGGSGTSPEFDENEFSDKSRTTGSEDMSKYFNVEISPKNIMLEPTYPMFFANWTQKVTIHVESSPDTPKGKYMIIIGPFGSIDAELNRYLSIEYGLRYSNMGGYYQEILKLGVEVT